MSARVRRVSGWVIAVLVIGGAFELIGDSKVIPEWPSLHAVISGIADSNGLFTSALGATVSAAGIGLLIGAAAAVALAGLAIILPRSRRVILAIAVFANALPLVVLGSLLISLVSATTCATVLAAIGVFFVVLLPFATGLDTISPVRAELFGALGASRWHQLRLLQVPSAIPLLADGIKLAVPAAILGATLGEWFVADRGLGAVLVSSMQNYEIVNLWAAALLAALTSVVGFGIASAGQLWCVRRFGDA
jgi:ABC-type nitrate/sulfonate/bicarbonate transport system permease component